MPRQRGTSVTEQAKVDLGPYVQSDNVQQISSRTIGNALHFLVICWPFGFRLLFEL
jgi:hypothetical protein